MNSINVMVNGIPGNMAVNVARHILEDPRFKLIPLSLTGPEIEAGEYGVGAAAIHLFRPDQTEDALKEITALKTALITIDYTHPTAVNANSEFYCRNGLPFVMGTTGGDRDALRQIVESSSISAVIAPNMAKPIVGFQAMMAYAAETFPNLFKGYALEIKESHQAGKADTSGTAKAMTRYFNALGIPFNVEAIQKERDPQVQKSVWTIPEAFLTGHGWHTYTLRSADETVCVEFRHNVNGRDVYALGTLDAAAFLSQKVNRGDSGRVYSMIDVLKRK